MTFDTAKKKMTDERDYDGMLKLPDKDIKKCCWVYGITFIILIILIIITFAVILK